MNILWISLSKFGNSNSVALYLQKTFILWYNHVSQIIYKDDKSDGQLSKTCLFKNKTIVCTEA